MVVLGLEQSSSGLNQATRQVDSRQVMRQVHSRPLRQLRTRSKIRPRVNTRRP